MVASRDFVPAIKWSDMVLTVYIYLSCGRHFALPNPHDKLEKLENYPSFTDKETEAQRS